MENLTQPQVECIVKTMADVAKANEQYFSDLDGVMGDADFGVSLAGGFRAVMNKWDAFDRTSIGSFLLNVASVIIANTGGCSGPIWGTLFMRCGSASKGKTELTLEEIVAMLKSAMDGMMARGGAKLGDKTLLDAISPAVIVMEERSGITDSLIEVFDKAAEAAYAAIEGTKGWCAKRGRQAFTGDRSIGTVDPGTVAVGTMAREIVKALRTRQA